MKLNIKIILLVVCLSYVAAVTEEAIDNAKQLLIEKEALIAASAVRNITLKTPQCKIQLVNMVTDFMVSANHAIYTLNVALANIVTDPGYKAYAAVIELISDSVNELQKSISGDSELLKEKLAKILELTNQAVAQFAKDFKPPNQFVFNQVAKKHNILLYAVFKVKIQSQLFHTSNKDLATELNASTEGILSVLKTIPALNPNKAIGKELRHSLQQLSTITDRNVNKLQNWIEVNSNNANGVKIIENVSLILSNIYDLLNHAAVVGSKVLHMKLQFIIILQAGMPKVEELTTINYPDNLGGEEFIRSSVISGIAIGRSFEANFKELVSLS